MQPVPLFTIGLVMPQDFNTVPYEAIHKRICSNSSTESDVFSQYSSAWNGVAYRFLSCADHDKKFTESIQQAGGGPPPPERYIQEHELFGFFVTGLSAIECLSYGVFSIGAMLKPHGFPTKTASDMRAISPEKTAKQLEKAFPEEKITISFNQLIASQEFRDWKEVRNILAHRSAPGRVVYLSTRAPARPALWKVGIQLDINTTASRRRWLADVISNFLEDLDMFTRDQFPH